MRVARIAWYVRRARTMEAGELRARAGSAIEAFLDCVRLRVSGRSGYELDRPPGEFDFCNSRIAKLPELEWDFRPSAAEAAALLSGEFPALGHSWLFEPGGESWRRAPDTGASWPQKFSDFIAYRGGNPFGDVRVMWEPNRLQQLVALALLARTEPAQAPAAIALLRRQLLDWAAANPMRRGINYISAMECSLRILSVAFASDIARRFLAHDKEYWAAVAKLVIEHASFVYSHLSLHSSVGNHTVAECGGLFAAAVLFPEHDRASTWEARAVTVLELAAGRTILPDGGPAEQALHYHAQILDHLEIAVLVGRHTGRDMDAIDRHLRAGAEFLSSFQTDRTQLPTIGDNDEGCALSRYRVPGWSARTSQTLELRNSTAISLETRGGYSIVRSDRDAAALIFDHGPLGMPPNCGHGHADALSLVLQLRGETVLVDPGTYEYGPDPHWREYFRSSAAHNTVTVDGLGQARPAGAFLWSGRYRCELLHTETADEHSACLVARHDAYAGLQVTHTRAIRVAAGSVVVVDRIDGEGSHELALRWHFAGILEKNGESMRLCSRPAVGVIVHGGDARIYEGSENPIAGWRSDLYGRKTPISTLCVSAKRRLPHDFVSIFVFTADAASTSVESIMSLSGLLDDLSKSSLDEPAGPRAKPCSTSLTRREDRAERN